MSSTVFVGPRAQTVLRPFLRTELAAYLFSPREAEQVRRAADAKGHRRPGQPETLRRTKNGRQTRTLGNFTDAMSPLRRLCGSSAAADFGPRLLKLVRDEMISAGWSRDGKVEASDLEKTRAWLKRCSTGQ